MVAERNAEINSLNQEVKRMQSSLKKFEADQKKRMPFDPFQQRHGQLNIVKSPVSLMIKQEETFKELQS